MSSFEVFPIGTIVNDPDDVRIALDAKYAPALQGLTGYSHVQVLWWADGSASADDRQTLIENKPYTRGPEQVGVFATRAPERPNPIAISTCSIAYVDETSGTIGLYYIDAFTGTKVLDLKPYTPSLDRVEHPETPEWCRHWPQSCETSGDFDWSSEFNF